MERLDSIQPSQLQRLARISKIYVQRKLSYVTFQETINNGTFTCISVWMCMQICAFAVRMLRN